MAADVDLESQRAAAEKQQERAKRGQCVCASLGYAYPGEAMNAAICAMYIAHVYCAIVLFLAVHDGAHQHQMSQLIVVFLVLPTLLVWVGSSYYEIRVQWSDKEERVLVRLFNIVRAVAASTPPVVMLAEHFFLDWTPSAFHSHGPGFLFPRINTYCFAIP